MFTLHCYQVHQKGEVGNEHKVKTSCFWFEHLYNPFTQKIGLEVHFERSGEESDTKYDKTKNTNIKEDNNDVNGQVRDPDVETADLPGDDSPKVFVS